MWPPIASALLLLIALVFQSESRAQAAAAPATPEKEWNCAVFRGNAWRCALNSQVAEAQAPAYCRRHLVLKRIVMPEQVRNIAFVLDNPRPMKCFSSVADRGAIPCPTDEVIDSCLPPQNEKVSAEPAVDQPARRVQDGKVQEGEWCESQRECAPGLTCSVNFCENLRRKRQ